VKITETTRTPSPAFAGHRTYVSLFVGLEARQLLMSLAPMCQYRVSQPGFLEVSLGVPREIVIEKNKHSFLKFLAKISRSTEKYHYLRIRALTIIFGLLYLQLTDHANVP
jgi:hypothetical protein